MRWQRRAAEVEYIEFFGDVDEAMVVGDGVHTPESPYCGDVGCWCHQSVAYHEMATHPVATAEEIERGYQFLEIGR